MLWLHQLSRSYYTIKLLEASRRWKNLDVPKHSLLECSGSTQNMHDCHFSDSYMWKWADVKGQDILEDTGKKTLELSYYDSNWWVAQWIRKPLNQLLDNSKTHVDIKWDGKRSMFSVFLNM